MRVTAVKSALAILAAIGVAVSLPSAGAEGGIRYRAAGKPAKQALKELSATLGVRYRATGALERQRLSLCLTEVSPGQIERWLTELLSVNGDTPVSWVETNDGEKVLTPSPEWLDLGEKLRRKEVSDYTQFLASEVAWLNGEGAQDLEVFLRERNPDIPEQRVRLALMLRSLGGAGRKRLLAGKPIVFQPAEVADDVSVALERVIPRSDIGRNQAIPKRFDRRCCVWRLSRSPGQARGFSVEESILTGDGGGSRGHVLTLPGFRQSRWPIGRVRSLRLPPADLNDPSRRVTVNLTPAPMGVNSPVRRTLDQLLARVAEDAGLNVVSDGYMRRQVQFEPNLTLRDYPLGQLLNSLGRVWDFDWRFAEDEERTVLIRSHAWYLEDEIDVSEEMLDSIRDKLEQPETVDLGYLSKLVELPAPKLHKLVTSGRLPVSLDVAGSGPFEEPVLPQLIRFVTRLDGPLRDAAKAQGGLPLWQAPEDLVREHFSVPLQLLFGRETPETLASLAVEYRETSPGNHRFVLTIRGLPLVDKTLAARAEAGALPSTQ